MQYTKFLLLAGLMMGGCKMDWHADERVAYSRGFIDGQWHIIMKSTETNLENSMPKEWQQP